MFGRDVSAVINTQSAIDITVDQVDAATVTGNGLDTMGYQTALFACVLANIGGTPTTTSVTFKLQDSADDATYADVVDGTVGQLGNVSVEATAAGVTRLEVQNLHATRRYVRVVATVAFTGGTSPDVDIACVACLGFPEELPA